jgi:hypothetical protein
MFITIVDIIHRPVFYLKFNVSPTSDGDMDYLCLLGATQKIWSPKRCVLNTRSWIISKIVLEMLTYQKNKVHGLSELYRLSDRRLSAKLVPTLAARGISRSHRGISPTAVISVFLDQSHSSVLLTRLRGPRSRPTTTQKIW